MPTPHEYRPSIHVRANYRLHEWRCTCGARCRAGTRSKITAELDWWSTHVLPDAVPPRHTCTLVEGGFENAVAWTCSCGDYGQPGGHRDERRAWQSHRAHENAALAQWYRTEWARLVQAQTPEEYAEFKRTEWHQRYAEEDRVRAERDARLAQMLLEELV